MTLSWHYVREFTRHGHTLCPRNIRLCTVFTHLDIPSSIRFYERWSSNNSTSTLHCIKVRRFLFIISILLSYSCYRIPHSIPVSTYEAMDPASAIISIASFGFTVFNKFNELRRTIKGAPEQIRALQDSCVVVELLIQKLRVVEMPSTGTIYSAEDLACLEVLCDRARQRLEDVERAIRRVAVHSPGRGSRIGLKIRVAKWILNKDGFEEISKKLNETRDALWTMLDFIQL